jgi:hypothetical protein
MKKFFSVLFILIFSFLAFSSVSYIELTSDYKGDVEGTVSLPYFFMAENYPTEIYINNLVSNDFLNLLEDVYSGIDQFKEDCKENDWPFRPFAVATDYQVGYNKEDFLSFYVDYYQFTGGAHGMTYRNSYNYNLTGGKKVELADLFIPEFGWVQYVTDFITGEINANKQDYFDDPLPDMKYNQEYYVTDEYLVIYYQLYEIAPYSTGFPEFKIPLKELGKNIILN